MTWHNRTLEAAAKRASAEFDREITVESLRVDTKAPFYSRPRFFAMAYLRTTGRYSLPQIARALHLKDHSTVLHGLRRAHGHDGKLRHKYTPLWNKAQFENMVAEDESLRRLAPQAYEKVNAEQILAIGLANLARYVRRFRPLEQPIQEAA